MTELPKDERLIAPLTTLAEGIAAIHAAAVKLEESGLTRRTVVLLLHDASKVPKRQITKVLDALGDFDRFLENYDV